MPTELKEAVRQTINEILQSLPPEEWLKGLTPEERLMGLSAEDKDRAFQALASNYSPEKLEALLQQLKSNGSSKQE